GLARRPAAEKPNHRHPRLLPASRERPRGCRAAEQRDEPASHHAAPPQVWTGSLTCVATKSGASCPLSVRLGHSAMAAQCPLCPERWGNRPASLWIAEN